MEISITIEIPDTLDCWQNGGFSCCQKLSRAYREKTRSQYFQCNAFNMFLEPVANEGRPIEPCQPCMDAREKVK